MIVAVDPGGTTGWATFKNDDVEWGEEADQFQICSFVEEILKREDEIVVVCESYIITPQTIKKSRQYEPLEIIGTLRYLAAKHGADFRLQSPSDAKRFVSDDFLKNVEWWPKGLVHARDALRHLFLYRVKNLNDHDLLRKARS